MTSARRTWARTMATRFFQLSLGKASIGPCLHRTGRRENDKCWWCNSGAVQTGDHLFKFCKRRKNERGSQRCDEGAATEALMHFLNTTKVGAWPERGVLIFPWHDIPLVRSQLRISLVRSHI